MKKTNYKIIKSLGVCMLFAALFGFLGATASAQTHQSKPFLNGYNMQTTANTTNWYGGTNIYAKGYTYTNAATYSTNGSTIYTNYNGTTGIKYNWVTNTTGIADATLWANRDGTTANASVVVQFTGSAASSTNTMTVRLSTVPLDSRSADYPPGLFKASTSSTFSFQVYGNGTTPVSVSTNLPTALLQGAKAIRVTGIESDAGGGGSINGIFLNGFTPIQ